MNHHKNINLVFFLAVLPLVVSCATKDFARFEAGEIIASRQNLKSQSLPEEYKISFERIGDDAHASLRVNIAKISLKKEEWEDIYSRTGVYKMRCKVYMNREDDHHKYCEFNSDWFWKIHASLVGLPFLYDVFVLPFWPYDERTIEVKEPAHGTISKSESDEVSNESSIDATSIKITIGKTLATANLTNGSAQVNLASLRVDPKKWPRNSNVTIEINNKKIDASLEFIAMINNAEAGETAFERERNIDQQRPQNKYKMEFCSDPDLYRLVFMSSERLRSNCIYSIGNAPLKVLQVVTNGILATSMQLDRGILDKVIFIKTDQQFVDGDILQNINVKYLGPTSYKTLLGAEKTIHSFQYLGER